MKKLMKTLLVSTTSKYEIENARNPNRRLCEYFIFFQLTARVQVLENIIGDIQGYIEKVKTKLNCGSWKENLGFKTWKLKLELDGSNFENMSEYNRVNIDKNKTFVNLNSKGDKQQHWANPSGGPRGSR